MKDLAKIVFALVVMTVVVSCGDKRKPSVQYMPDMYVAVPYEPNGAVAPYNNGMVDRDPVAGTIARGQVPYEYPNTNEGYTSALKDLKSPLKKVEAHLANGKKMYDIYCISCHGKSGKGDGVLVQRDKFSGIPNFKDRAITEGSIYHVIMYGRGIMGSHASQLRVKERWQVVQYVEKLRNDLLK